MRVGAPHAIEADAACIACAKGQFGDGVYAHQVAGTGCTPCPAGKFQPAMGQHHCHRCHECSYRAEVRDCAPTAQGKCKECEVGRFALQPKCGGKCKHATLRKCAGCLPCAAGFFRDGCEGHNVGRCYPCPPGRFKPSVGEWTTGCDECSSCGTTVVRQRAGCGGVNPGECASLPPSPAGSMAPQRVVPTTTRAAAAAAAAAAANVTTTEPPKPETPAPTPPKTTRAPTPSPTPRPTLPTPLPTPVPTPYEEKCTFRLLEWAKHHISAHKKLKPGW